MRNFLINSALSLTMGLTGLPLFAGQASAQDVELRMGRDGPQLRLRESCNPDFEDCYEGRGDGRYGRDRRGEERFAQRGCTEDRALNKAERMGVRRARIADAGRRTIEVSGRARNGARVYLTFGRQPSCPVLD